VFGSPFFSQSQVESDLKEFAKANEKRSYQYMENLLKADSTIHDIVKAKVRTRQLHSIDTQLNANRVSPEWPAEEDKSAAARSSRYFHRGVQESFSLDCQSLFHPHPSTGDWQCGRHEFKGSSIVAFCIEAPPSNL
jgi:hypothetical protein